MEQLWNSFEYVKLGKNIIKSPPERVEATSRRKYSGKDAKAQSDGMKFLL